MPLLLIVVGLYLLGHPLVAAWIALLGGALGYLAAFIGALIKAVNA